MSEISKTIDDAAATTLAAAARQNSGEAAHAQAIPAGAGTTTTIQPRRHYLYQLGNEIDLTMSDGNGALPIFMLRNFKVVDSRLKHSGMTKSLKVFAHDIKFCVDGNDRYTNKLDINF